MLLQTGHIGMGTPHTWHGTSDARVRRTDLVWLNASEDPEDGFLVTEGSNDESDVTTSRKLVAKEVT